LQKHKRYKCPHTYGHIFFILMIKKIWDSYTTWLFDILFEQQKRIKLKTKRNYTFAASTKSKLRILLSMKILIEFVSATLPVIKYGGSERVAWGLGKELTKLGHEVFFLVKEGSTCDFATILPYDSQKDLKSQIPNDIDFVHLFQIMGEPLNQPYLFTMEGNVPPGHAVDKNTVFVSKNHATRHGATEYVYNGIDWEDYPDPVLDGERTYVHFLAKASWKVKNLFGTAKVALKSGNKLHVMGGTRWNYANIKRGLKYILNPNLVFHGMVDNTKKIEIAQHSKALLFPVNWHEPFGIAMTESMYAGCAVFGTKNGSLEELILPEVGVTSNSSDELAEAIKKFDYNPKRCHDHAVKYFNSKLMTERYLELYDKVISGASLNEKAPMIVEKENHVAKLR